MINKLIDKYREKIRASKEEVEEQRQQRFPDEVTIRSEITRFNAYETAIKDLEEFLKNKRKDIYSSNLRSETRYETIMIIQDILSIIDGSDE